jgi:phage repressor protein C with HTH and peptisase S24 domain
MTTTNSTPDMGTSTFTWQSDSMEPTIDFGDDITVTPTGGVILGDGMYLLTIDRDNIQPPGARALCAPVLRVIWRVTRQPDGRFGLTHDSPDYSEADSVVSQAELLRIWSVAGRVAVAKRNGRRWWRQKPKGEELGVRAGISPDQLRFIRPTTL